MLAFLEASGNFLLSRSPHGQKGAITEDLEAALRSVFADMTEGEAAELSRVLRGKGGGGEASANEVKIPCDELYVSRCTQRTGRGRGRGIVLPGSL